MRDSVKTRLPASYSPAEESDIRTLAGPFCRITPDTGGGREAALKRLQSHSRFLEHCLQNGLAPLVYRNLKALGLEARLNDQVRDGLRMSYYRTLADNLRSFEDLREVALASVENRIPLLVLKGPTLVHLVYGDPAIRPMDDIDLLVHPEDILRLEEALRRLGYTPHPLYPDLFRRGKTVLDLHTDPINRSRIEARGAAVRLDIDALWRNALPLPDFPQLQMLGPSDQVLTLAVHAVKHGFQQDIWLVDIAECLDLLQTPREWDRLQVQTRTTGTTGILTLTLYMLRHRLQRELPPPAGEILGTFHPSPLERRLLDVATQPGMPQVLEPLLLMRSLEGTRQKVGCLFEMAFPRPEILSQVSGLNGPWTFWLSYPYRLAQLFGMAFHCAVQFGRQILNGMGHRPIL